MAEPEPANLTDLHALAREYAETLLRVNAPLPDEFPIEQMREVTRALLTLDGSPTEDEQRALAYARGKLREARKVLRIHARDPEAPSYFEIERAHNALFAELDVLVEAIPPQTLLELQPSSRNGPLVVRRAELEGKVAALEQRVSAVEAQSRDALARIDQRRNVVSLIYIENPRLHLSNLIKVVTTLRAELRASLIDLQWLAELATRIGELAKALGQAVDAARKGASQLSDIIKSANKARLLAERVAAGGKSLLGWVRRSLGHARMDSPAPVRTFRDIDAPWCPEMVVIPPGKFLMGSPVNEPGRQDDEGPQHEVSFGQPFAVGHRPVTFEEYDRFAEELGRQPADDKHWGRGRNPVINVSCNDAKHYVSWLSEQTGRYYRLLSEAEWEYVCRAGTTTQYSWGNIISPKNANYAESGIHKSVEVGSYPPNAWSLHDMHGNLWEWVEDCWNGSYEGAPTDGSAWISGDCGHRVLRGGSWFSRPEPLRSAYRIKNLPDGRDDSVGFRVARTLR
jgi:formylglycine-generating enzyme required for sulfatase activity